MIILTTERDSTLTRRAHARHISASDMAGAFARNGTKLQRELIERLVLDFEGVEDHTPDFPDPWYEEHEHVLRCAVAMYRLETGLDTSEIGFCADDRFTWLGCTPHALVDDTGCLHVRHRKTLRSFGDPKHRRVDRVELARAHVVMYVCNRAWCDVVDYWEGGDRTLDKLRRQRLDFSAEFFAGTVVPRLVAVWQAVAARRAERATAPP